MGLMEIAEEDLEVTLEDLDGWGLPVVLTRKSDSFTETVNGQVLRDSVIIDEESQNPIVNHTPVVSLRLSSLTNIPSDDEIWYFDIPNPLNQTVITKRFVFDKNDAQRGFQSIGLKTFPLKEYKDNR